MSPGEPSPDQVVNQPTLEQFIRSIFAEADEGLLHPPIRPGTLARWKSALNSMPPWLRQKRLDLIDHEDSKKFLQHLHTRTWRKPDGTAKKQS
ncbi:MAG: hypothetical protein OJF52_001173 [Nitrospira sp.]|nr:MAG: hypothetical protein OJF52_001173 [Nitrospira sp.]